MADHSALVAVVARALADEPDAVRVTVGERRGATHYELHVAPRDLGRVIGRQGRTAAALRLLLSAAAEAAGGKAQLDIRDSDGRS
ncbi:MAG: KH domain-containing protein [Vicinamibacterales bacterium]|nr:KH domain-containing protein [Vicinamibacterales bacterium]